MEEYDDLTQGPNEDGTLNLSYDQWKLIPNVIYESYSNRLLNLNLSHNKLHEITEDISKLSLLKELNVSHNNIVKIHPAIGKCVRLRKFNASHNKLRFIPNEFLSQCKLMDSLVLSSNNIKTLSDDICNLPALEVLDIRDNQLQCLPTKLYTIQCLRRLLCDKNDNLLMIHKDLRSTTDLVLWILKLHQTYKDEITQLENEYADIEYKAKDSLLQKLLIEEKETRLQIEIETLNAARPNEYIRRKRHFLIWVNNFRKNVQNQMGWIRRKLRVK